MGLSWTAIIIDWSQVGYWRFRIELSTIEAILLLVPHRDILTGGGSVNTTTVEHLYTIQLFAIGWSCNSCHYPLMVYCDKKKKEYGIGGALKGELQGKWDKPMPLIQTP